MRRGIHDGDGVSLGLAMELLCERKWDDRNNRFVVTGESEALGGADSSSRSFVRRGHSARLLLVAAVGTEVSTMVGGQGNGEEMEFFSRLSNEADSRRARAGV
jgi:hypothetical protein